MPLSELVLEELKSLVLMVNHQGKVLFTSKYIKSFLDVDVKDLQEKNLFNFIKLDEKRFLKHRILRWLADMNNRETHFESTLTDQFGMEKWINWELTKVDDVHILVIGNDITQQKNAELSLREKHYSLLEQSKEHIQSLEYAKRLQEAILPDLTGSVKHAQESMVLYLPRDIVSGDFYWSGENDHGTFIAAVDCTGHGIPGAMLTVMANTMLREVVLNRNLSSPAQILDELDKMLQHSFLKEDGRIEANDGFDISLVKLKPGKITFAGAYRPLVHISQNELIEYPGNRYPIGFYFGYEKSFEETVVYVDEGDRIYIFSDGYIDQFGGENTSNGGKKFSKKKFKELLLSTTDLSLKEQQKFLNYAFNNWKQDLQQIDDVLVIGVQF